jgi:ADP-heptose:LPS heptosyltransferase
MPHPLTRFIPTPLRRIEPVLRSRWLRLALHTFAGDGGPLPDWDLRPFRLLFIRYDKLGDMIMCSGVLREIVRAHPTITVDVLTTPANAPALENLPFIREVIRHERGKGGSDLALARRWRAHPYDVAVDGLVWRPSVSSYTTKLLIASGARWRIGSAGRPNEFVYNVPVRPPASRWAEHHIEHLARLAGPFGVTDADWRPEIALTSAERHEAERDWGRVGGSSRVLVNLSAGHPERRWADDRFGALLHHLRRRLPNAGVAVVAMPNERDSAQRLATAIGATPVIPTVRELFALVAAADLVVTPDTAVAHIASAFARPTLALLRRRAEYHIWVPYRTPGRNVFGDEELTLDGLPVARVVAALDELLDDRSVLGSLSGDAVQERRSAARRRSASVAGTDTRRNLARSSSSTAASN